MLGDISKCKIIDRVNLNHSAHGCGFATTARRHCLPSSALMYIPPLFIIVIESFDESDLTQHLRSRSRDSTALNWRDRRAITHPEISLLMHRSAILKRLSLVVMGIGRSKAIAWLPKHYSIRSLNCCSVPSIKRTRQSRQRLVAPFRGAWI